MILCNSKLGRWIVLGSSPWPRLIKLLKEPCFLVFIIPFPSDIIVLIGYFRFSPKFKEFSFDHFNVVPCVNKCLGI